MAIPEEVINEIKYKNDISDIISQYSVLKRRGKNLVGLCPFHNEKTPSFTVYPENGSFYCFGCGATGDVITFTSRLLGISNASAARQLARDFGISAEEPSEYPVIPKSQAQKDFENWCHFASEILRRYNQLLFEWKFLAPKDPGEDFHFLFVDQSFSKRSFSAFALWLRAFFSSSVISATVRVSPVGTKMGS